MNIEPEALPEIQELENRDGFFSFLISLNSGKDGTQTNLILPNLTKPKTNLPKFKLNLKYYD